MSVVSHCKLIGLKAVTDESLVIFNSIMNMETMSLLDNERQSSMRTDLTLHEKYESRLVCADLGARSQADPFQRCINKYLRHFRYWRMSKKVGNDPEAQVPMAVDQNWSYQNTIVIANVFGRVITAIVAGVFLVLPLTLLSTAIRGAQLGVVAVFILLFSFLVGIMLKMSNYEMMVVSAAYAAILSVFVSNES